MSGTATGSSGAATWSATKGTKVLDISYLVTNDEDSGFVGYWALDSYLKTAQVWQDPNNAQNFYVIATYTGIFQTFKGALSPMNGVKETKDATGIELGFYYANFQSSSFTSKFGFIGTFNYGGTKSDILLGSYGAGQIGDTTPFDFVLKYFGAGADSSFAYIMINGFQQWSWTYYYGEQTWVNAGSGSSGDIVT